MIHKIASAFLLAVLLLFSPLLYGRSWSIADYSDSISVREDGSALVTEKIACVFVGEYHGIFRDIPIEYPGPKGTNFTLYLDVVAITDQDGNKLKYESSNQNGNRHLKIYVPGAVDARREVNISYRVKNGIRHFPEFDEFYWNVTGNDWPVPIDHATAYVTLPDKAAGAGLRAQAFTGEYGSTGTEVSAKIDGARADFETTNPLAMRGGFTIDIYIPKGIVKEPGALTRLAWFLGSNPILFLPVFAFAVMFTLWYVKGRDPDPGISVAPMYQPPEGMSPAECGALLSDGIHQRDITSTIVDLAVRGYIKIEETDEKHLFLSSKNYMFRLMKPRTEWSNLTGHERELLEGMFGGPALAAAISKIPRLAGLVPQGTLQALQEKIGPAESDVTSLAQLKNRFYVHLPAIQTYIKSSLKQKGMYGVDPDSAHGYALLGAVLIAGPFILLQWSGYVNFALSFGLLIVSAIVAAIIFFIFARIMPAKSLRGARTAVSIRGFQEFMNRVDRERLRAMPADTFEKFLPYAMALGVEEHWAHAFDGLLKQPPTWYAGPNMMSFNPMIFTHDIRTMTDAAGQTFVSAPRASSSGSGWGGGGGGGGGFSGGGFGGGGGGAF